MKQIFGGIDISVGLIFWIDSMLNLIGLNIIPDWLIIFLGIVLLVKGLVFAISLDVLSILDVIAAITILVSVFLTLNTIIIHMVGLYLVGKGIMSLGGSG